MENVQVVEQGCKKLDMSFENFKKFLELIRSSVKSEDKLYELGVDVNEFLQVFYKLIDILGESAFGENYKSLLSQINDKDEDSSFNKNCALTFDGFWFTEEGEPIEYDDVEVDDLERAWQLLTEGSKVSFFEPM